jgi:hypothetical protein
MAEQFDTKVRAPLWFAIHDALGGQWHDPTFGESGWTEEFFELEERLKRRLGVWDLSTHVSAGDPIEEFIKRATSGQLEGVVDEASAFVDELRRDEKTFQKFDERIEQVRRSLKEWRHHARKAARNVGTTRLRSA